VKIHADDFQEVETEMEDKKTRPLTNRAMKRTKVTSHGQEE